MVTRHELSDYQWQIIEPCLPQHSGSGRPPADHRLIFNGILWRIKTGTPWRDLPVKYGPWQTVFHRFNSWRKDGVWDQILATLQFYLDQIGLIDWDLFSIDGSNVRAHKAAAGASGKKEVTDEPDDHALGYSRGGFGTKLHLVTDGQGLPLAITLTPGQQHESTVCEETLNAVRIKQESGPARTRPKAVTGDKAYSSKAIRDFLRDKKIEAVIPLKRDQKRYRKGRAPNFDREKYKERNAVERCIGWIKECRAVATRYEKLAVNYLATAKLAMIRLCLQKL